jgi:16S rRNA (uracil1498-N3)-methyltransferase
MIRLHVPQPLTAGAAIAPSLDQSRYLTQVMRLKAGDVLRVFNGSDGEWRCTVAEVLKRGVVLRAEAQERPQTFGPDLELIVAVVKKARVETIVEKAAELGARRVRLAITQRTNADRIRLDRLDAIAEEAAEQTGRMDVPLIDEPARLETLLDGWDAERRLMFCDETGGAPVASAVTRPGPWAVLIGAGAAACPAVHDGGLAGATHPEGRHGRDRRHDPVAGGGGRLGPWNPLSPATFPPI